MTNLSARLHEEAIRDTIRALRYEAGLSRRVLAHLRGLEKDLLAALAQAGDLTSQRKFRALLGEAQAAIADRFGEATGLFDDELKQFGAIQAGTAVSALNAAVGVDMFGGITADQAKAIASDALIEGAPSSEWWGRQEADTLQRFKNIVRTGMSEGQTGDQMARLVRDMMDTSMRNAQTLVRTSVITINANAHMAAFEANDDIIEGVTWTSTLDARTCARCFPGETIISTIGDIEKLFKRFYEGEMVVVTTSTGKQLKGTPNHPVLTAQGWLPLNEIKPNEHVVYSPDREGLCVLCYENVGMPATFSEIADSFFNPSISNVFWVGSSTAQFHGDGMSGDHKVCVAEPNRHLGNRRDSVTFQHIKKDGLGFSHDSGDLFGACKSTLTLVSRMEVPNPSKRDLIPAETLVKPGFRANLTQHERDLERTNTPLKQVNSELFIRHDRRVTNAPLKMWHDSEILQKAGHGGGGGFEIACKCCGRFAVPVAAENVISVGRENFSGHVYNLQSYPGLYIAGGIIVHNCGALDGKSWKLREGHPVPAIHFSCRCSLIPKTKSWEQLAREAHGNSTLAKRLDEMTPGTRASMDGQVAGTMTYEDWLNRLVQKDAKTAEEILGPARFRLMQSGKLTLRDLTDMSGHELSLKDLVKR